MSKDSGSVGRVDVSVSVGGWRVVRMGEVEVVAIVMCDYGSCSGGLFHALYKM